MKRAQHGGLLYKVFGVIVGMFFVVTIFNEQWMLSSLQKHGKRAEAEPVAHYVESKKRGRTTFSAMIRFTTQDGRKMAEYHTIPSDVLADFKAERPVAIVYMPEDPSTFAFANQKPSWTWFVVAVIFSVAALILA